MASIIVTYRILPDAMDHFELIRDRLAGLNPMALTEEPIAFGLKALILKVSLPEQDGAEEEMERKLRSIEGVKECETVLVTRAM